jgi:hypothetical protein
MVRYSFCGALIHRVLSVLQASDCQRFLCHCYRTGVDMSKDANPILTMKFVYIGIDCRGLQDNQTFKERRYAHPEQIKLPWCF